MYMGFHVKYPLLLSDFNENLIFSTYFQKILKCQIHENSSSGAALFHADEGTDGRTDRQTDTHTDRQTDMMFIVSFRNFANAPKSSNLRHRARRVGG
jgi:hypothetical protein